MEAPRGEPPDDASRCVLRWSEAAQAMSCEALDEAGGAGGELMPLEVALVLGLPFDVNAADAEALQRVRGVGRGRAARIVETRERLGGFCALEELAQVHGIGAATVERLRERLTVVPAARCVSAGHDHGHGDGEAPLDPTWF